MKKTFAYTIIPLLICAHFIEASAMGAAPRYGAALAVAAAALYCIRPDDHLRSVESLKEIYAEKNTQNKLKRDELWHTIHSNTEKCLTIARKEGDSHLKWRLEKMCNEAKEAQCSRIRHAVSNLHWCEDSYGSRDSEVISVKGSLINDIRCARNYTFALRSIEKKIAESFKADE